MPVDLDPRIKDINDYIESSLTDWDLPGVSVAIVYKDEVVHAQGFGVKEIGRDDRNDEHTLFQIGSTSKAFGAAAIAALVDDGTVDWDDKVITHRPDFLTPDPHVTNNATLRQLLSHTSRIGGDMATSAKIVSPEQAFRRLSRDGTVLDNAGAYFYSNSGYGLTQNVAEGAQDLSWYELVSCRLFEPSGMTSSYASCAELLDPEYFAPTFLGTAPVGNVSITDFPELNIALPHGYDRQGKRRILPWKTYDPLGPAGGIVSNAVDMAQWLKLWLNRGVVEGQRVLSEVVIDEMIRPQTSVDDGYYLYADQDHDAEYALGWSVARTHGKRVIYHGGGIFGFPAFVAFYPDDGLGVAVMANGNTLSPYYPHQEILAWSAERLLGFEKTDLRSKTLASLKHYREAFFERQKLTVPPRKDNPPPSLPLIAYTGEYQSGPDEGELGRATIAMYADELRFKLSEPGEMSGDLEPWGEDTFKLHYHGGDGAAWSGEMARFKISDGRVDQVKFDLLGTFAKTD